MEDKNLNDYLKKDIELTQQMSEGISPLYGMAAQELYRKINTDGIDAMSYVIKELGKKLKEEENKVVEKHEQFGIGDYVKVEHSNLYKGFILEKKISRPNEAKIQVTVSKGSMKPGSTLWIDLNHPTVFHDNEPQLDRVDINAMINISLMWKDEGMFSYASDKLKNYRPPRVF